MHVPIGRQARAGLPRTVGDQAESPHWLAPERASRTSAVAASALLAANPDNPVPHTDTSASPEGKTGSGTSRATGHHSPAEAAKCKGSPRASALGRMSGKRGPPASGATATAALSGSDVSLQELVGLRGLQRKGAHCHSHTRDMATTRPLQLGIRVWPARIPAPSSERQG